jgi:tRNA A-37 threonylcarbamoyl transferase component Bud32
LRELIDAATRLGRGIGGTAGRIDIDGISVFVKLVPLTAIEMTPQHAASTANTFSLPAFFHYGIGSPGFGGWRELAAHVMTTNWVLAGEYAGFPLLYHWRVLPDMAPALPEELADIDRTVAYWGGREEVRQRIEALAKAPASIALFLERIPHNLHQWLSTQFQAGDQAADRACALAERELEAGTAFMNDQGLLHFDAHFENILADGQRLYFTDYGLALSSRFELSPEETAFYRQHRSYDRCYTRTHLVHWLITALHGHRGEARDALVRAYAGGAQPTEVLPTAAAILARHSPLAVVMADF